MNTATSRTETIVSLELTADERRTLRDYYSLGDAILRAPRDPSEVDEVGQPMLDRRTWGTDEAYIAHRARIGQAVGSFMLGKSGEDGCVLRGSRDAVDYIRSCVFMSLVIDEGMNSSDILAGNDPGHPGLAIHSRLMTLSQSEV